MINRAKEDVHFIAKVAIAYRLCEDRYYVQRLYRSKEEYGGEIYRIVGRVNQNS